MQSLVTLEWAVDYFENSRPKAEEWNAADGALRLQYINWASMMIRAAFTFQSEIVVDNDDRIRVATCEQALWLMRRTDIYPDVLCKGIVNTSVGSLSATFSKDFVAPLICEEAKLVVSEIGTFIGNVGTIKIMPLGW